jgi:MSHA biogenesis protein MshP
MNRRSRRALGATSPLMRLAALHRQGGFAIASGVFLITILALLSAYLVGFRVYQDSAFSLDTLGTRAYAAARGGAEWGAYDALRNGACAASTSFGLGGTLAGFTATVRCTRDTYNEAGTDVNIDTIVVNACNQPAGGNCPNAAPGAYYAERQVTISVGR